MPDDSGIAGIALPALARRIALVRRAQAFVEAQPDSTPTVADLRRATGACRRTQQASGMFRHFGRFAADYRTISGEPPSRARARSAGRAGPPADFG